jgi:hypothetical protein
LNRFFLFFRKNIAMVLMASPGSARFSMFILKPTVATIQPVMVEPRLDPMITASAFLKGIMPASTNPSVIRAMTDELCKKAVNNVPPAMAFITELVLLRRNHLKDLPESLVRAWSMS